VLLGETAPRGSDRAVAPLAFLRGVLCLDGSSRPRGGCARLDVDGVAHHPYAPREGADFVPRARDDVTIGVLDRLVATLDRAARAGALPARTPVYLTEFGVESLPDRLRGVSLARRPRSGPRPSGSRSSTSACAPWRSTCCATTRPARRARARPPQRLPVGLRTAAGRAKPALAGFRLPLAARRAGRRASLWGLVRPARGRVEVTVQAADGRGWRPVRRVRTDGRGALRLRTAAPPGRRWRTVWRAPDGTVHRSAPVRAR
jgi:hypothetical protein